MHEVRYVKCRVPVTIKTLFKQALHIKALKTTRKGDVRIEFILSFLGFKWACIRSLAKKGVVFSSA